ncbi:MAG: FkbM family methyltransferase, partial [Aggregatilineales bacterium]
SNTYSFELAGWQGICVEAHPDYIEPLTKNRPGSEIFFAAAGDKRDTVTFYANSRGSLSTLDKSQEETYAATFGEFFTGFEAVEVEMRTLTDMLEAANAPRPVDIISIDVEGAEQLVLEGFNLEKFQPRVVIIEAIDDNFEQQLDAYFAIHHYHKSKICQDNIFYCRDKADATRLLNIPVECEVIHTPHMLDHDAEPQIIRISESAQPLPTSPTLMKRIQYFVTRRIKQLVR